MNFINYDDRGKDFKPLRTNNIIVFLFRKYINGFPGTRIFDVCNAKKGAVEEHRNLTLDVDESDKLVERIEKENNIKNIVGKHFMYYQYLTDDNNYIDKECEVYSYDEEKRCFYTSVGEISKYGFFHDLKCGAFRIMTKTEVWK